MEEEDEDTTNLFFLNFFSMYLLLFLRKVSANYFTRKRVIFLS